MSFAGIQRMSYLWVPSLQRLVCQACHWIIDLNGCFAVTELYYGMRDLQAS